MVAKLMRRCKQFTSCFRHYLLKIFNCEIPAPQKCFAGIVNWRSYFVFSPRYRFK
nr:MAG TPA: hypothetical protein [Caudoviricetes sp.]